MSAWKLGCSLVVLVVLVLAGMALFKPPDLPAGARQSVEDYVRRFEGQDFKYSLVSYEKAARTMGGEVGSIEFVPGGVSWPAGIRPPNGPTVVDNWCVIVDKPVETCTGNKATHFIVQQQGQLWLAEGVSDRNPELFKHFGCGRW